MGQKGQKQTQPGLLMSYPCVFLSQSTLPKSNRISQVRSNLTQSKQDTDDRGSQLTICAVISSPARQTLPGAVSQTFVVAEHSALRAFAHDVARIAVVERIALDPEVELDRLSPGAAFFARPLGASVEPALLVDTVDQRVASWKSETGHR